MITFNKSTLALILGVVFATSAHAVPIAIVDSGTDLNHADLKNVQWTNLKDEDDAVDNDDNGYIDDVHGWNFAEQNDQLFDKRLLGKFPKDVYTFFEIQTKALKGTATPAEIDWMKAKVKDAAFLDALQTFGNFVHGSHVAGIASKDSAQAQIMPIKLIPTKRPKLFSSIESNGMVAKAGNEKKDENKKKLVLMAIDFLGKQQSQAFAPIAAYLKAQGARVANCSFGTGYDQAEMLLKPLLTKIFKRELPQAELHEYVMRFMTAVLTNSKASFVDAAPDTLFVIAAGNSALDNDAFPASPANIKANNTITVAASDGFEKLAKFSNYGITMVDVAAPGVGINSAVPGGEHVLLSGTSQAAPYVANIAGQILDINPKLSTAEVRQILMETSDFKSFLKDKVKSSGIVNTDRAKKGAFYSRSESLSNAIAHAVVEVRDQPEVPYSVAGSERVTFVMPLPSLPF